MAEEQFISVSVNKCAACNDYIYSFEPHICKPRFEVLIKNRWMGENDSIETLSQDSYDELEWASVHANDLLQAARIYVTRDAHHAGGQYSQDNIVYVKDPHGKIIECLVRAEMALDVWVQDTKPVNRVEARELVEA